MIQNEVVTTYLVVSVGEVETGHVHASVQHFNEIFDIPTRWAKGANDFGLPCVGVDALEDVLELNATRVCARRVAWFYHSILTACSCMSVFLACELALLLT